MAPSTSSVATGSAATVTAPAAVLNDELMAATGHILVVDDEPTIRQVVARYLDRAGFRTSMAATGEEALQIIDTDEPDLIILDVMLPGIGGLSVLRQISERKEVNSRVILLTARGEESERIAGFRQGADDYVVKPFSPGELVARVEAVLRRSAPQDEPIDEILQYGDLTIDPIARRVAVRGSEVVLTQREYELLTYLAQHPNRAFSRDELLEAVWGYSFYTDSSTVTVHIRRLRVKLEKDPTQPRYVQTVWGVGYRFAP